jgi:hypothetical protein
MLISMATNTNNIRFLVTVRPPTYGSDNDRLEVVVHPVIIEGGKIRNLSWGYGSEGGEFADLQAGAWIDKTFDREGFIFQIHDCLEYREVYTINEPRAESMAKTLRLLNRRISKLIEKFGYPQDFAAFLGYLGQAVGCKDRNPFARKVSGNGWSHDDQEYRWMDVDALRYHLAEKIREWKGEK